MPVGVVGIREGGSFKIQPWSKGHTRRKDTDGWREVDGGARNRAQGRHHYLKTKTTSAVLIL